jgi:hypothetical protein
MKKRYVYIVESNQLNRDGSRYELSHNSYYSSKKLAKANIDNAVECNTLRDGGEVTRSTDNPADDIEWYLSDNVLFMHEYYWVNTDGSKVYHRVFLRKEEIRTF